jgi:hypothetical protein
MVTFLLTEEPRSSVTFTVNLELPAFVGVPTMSSELRMKPKGRASLNNADSIRREASTYSQGDNIRYTYFSLKGSRNTNS